MRTLIYKIGYVSGWLHNADGMPLGMSIAEVLEIGGVTIGMLLLINFLTGLVL